MATMIKAIVLDLEDTLLHGAGVPFAEIIEQSTKLVSRSNGDIAELETAFIVATNQLAMERDMITCNADVLVGNIAKNLRITFNDAEDRLDEFFTLLGGTTRKHMLADACAVPLMNALLQQNLSVAIAIKPVYPETLVLEWLDWAGLSAIFTELAFVAHNKNLHFVNPDPAYYAELVARIGVEPDETIVIGHGRSNVLAAAESAGLHTWEICESSPLAAFFEHIHSTSWRDEYSPRPVVAETIEPQFRGNVGALYGLLAEAKAHQWLQKPDPDEWSILQILCHLADAEVTVHQHRLKRILSEDRPFLGSPSPPGPDLPPCHDDGYIVLHQFREERLNTVRLLAGLQQEHWQRSARHSIFGLTSLREMAYFTAQHDRLHITQLCQTLGKCTDTY